MFVLKTKTVLVIRNEENNQNFYVIFDFNLATRF